MLIVIYCVDRKAPGSSESGGDESTELIALALVLVVCVKYDLSDTLLCCGVNDRSQQREASAFTVDRIRAGRERDAATAAAATFPDTEANQLQSLERSFRKV